MFYSFLYGRLTQRVDIAVDPSQLDIHCYNSDLVAMHTSMFGRDCEQVFNHFFLPWHQTSGKKSMMCFPCPAFQTSWLC